MCKIDKASRRDSKINKRRSGHQVDNRNIFILEEQKKKRSEAWKRKRKDKESYLPA